MRNKGIKKLKENIRLILFFYAGAPIFSLISIFLKVWSMDSFKLSSKTTAAFIVVALFILLLSIIILNVKNAQLIKSLTVKRVINSIIVIVLTSILFILNIIFSLVEQVSNAASMILIISLIFFAISCITFLDFIKKFFYGNKIKAEKKVEKVKKIKETKKKKIDLLKQYPVDLENEDPTEEIIIENKQKGEI